MKKAKDYFRQVYIKCDGYMLAIDQHHRLENIKEWLAGLQNGIKAEVERRFNEQMADPNRWADFGFANILERGDEAEAHNAPIREAQERQNKVWDAEHEAARIAEEKAEKQEYEDAIRAAENILMSKGSLENSDLHGKSLIMQLFREHEIAVPLKTQGWILSSLESVYYNSDKECWSYRYRGNPSTVFSDYLDKLLAAVQTKQQFEEMNQNPGDGLPPDSHIEEEHEDDAEI